MLQNQDIITPDDEEVGINPHFLIIRDWDKSVETLNKQFAFESLSQAIGFDLPTLAEILNKEFPENIEFKPVNNTNGEKIEDVAVETLTVNDRPLDRILVIAYPSAANPSSKEMTKFLVGGEVIFITEGSAEITYARGDGETISRDYLRTERVNKGDLIISTDTPNNWTKVLGDKFAFLYFVGNPGGPQTYSEIPKRKIPIK